MQIKRLEFSDAPIELIDKLAGNYFFSSTPFGSLWNTLGGKPVYWVAENSGNVTAVLQGVEFGKGMFRRFQSMPNGCYTKMLFNATESDEKNKATELIVAAIKKQKYVKTFLTDFHQSMPEMKGFERETLAVDVVDISAPDWEPPDSKLRQQIHKGERENLILEKFNAPNHMDDFVRLHDLHEKRRAVKSGYTRRFFESLSNIAESDSRVNWVWCSHNGQAVSSHIFFTEGDSILHWQMYYDDELSHLQATKYVPYKIAKESAQKGIKFLNLGLSPSGAEGAEFYKKKWGGEDHTYTTFFKKTFLGKLK